VTPQAGVGLVLLKSGACKDDTLWDAAVTNASGNYTLTGIDGNYLIITFNPVASALANASALVALSATPATQNIALAAGTTVTGKVVDASSFIGITGARLSLDGVTANSHEEALTSPTGDFTLHLTAGDWKFEIQPPSGDITHAFLQPRYTIAGPAQALGNQPLATGVRISGTVTHTGDGTPMPGVQMDAQISSPCCNTVDRKGVSGGGSYNMVVPAGATYNLQARLDSDTFFIDGNSSVVVASSNVVQNFVIQDAGIITGIVRDSLNAPILDLGIAARIPLGTQVAYDNTCSDGSYRLRVPPSVSGYHVTTSYPNNKTPPFYAAQTWNTTAGGTYFECEGTAVPVSPAGTTVPNVNFTVPLAAAVQGAITSEDSGCTFNPFGFVQVTLDNGVSHACNLGTNAQNPPPGQYQLLLLPPNTVMTTLRACVNNVPLMSPQCYNLVQPPAYNPISILPGGAASGINFCLGNRPLAQVAGLLVGKSGGKLTFNWTATADPYHYRYTLWGSTTATPVPPPGTFPSNPAFSSLIMTGGTNTVLGIATGSNFFLLTDTGLTGINGPSGSYGN
jgi:hypothetical protein